MGKNSGFPQSTCLPLVARDVLRQLEVLAGSQTTPPYQEYLGQGSQAKA